MNNSGYKIQLIFIFNSSLVVITVFNFIILSCSTKEQQVLDFKTKIIGEI